MADKIGYQKQRVLVRSSSARNDVQMKAITTQLQLLDESFQVDKQKLDYEYKDANEKLIRNKPVFEGGYMAQVEWRQLELNLLKAQTALINAQLEYNNKVTTLQAQLAELQVTKTSFASTTDKIRSDELSATIQLRSDYENTLQLFSNLFGYYEIANSSLIIKSRINGRIAYLSDDELEIKESATLLKISSRQSPDYGFIKCQPSLVGKIRAQQDCYLKVASFPFYEWGTLKGKIAEISTAPDENGQFNIKVAFDTQTHLQPLLQAGLTGQAVIIIDKKTLLQYFFRSAAKNYHKFIKGDFIPTDRAPD